MKKVFDWAREVNISQPITSGHWNGGSEFSSINAYILNNSDVNTFHAYCDVSCTVNAINSIKGNLCELFRTWKTDYMYRVHGQSNEFKVHHTSTTV
jgi:hypothetical protein